MGKKRANQPGYKESTDALGRKTWVPDGSAKSTKKDTLENMVSNEMDRIAEEGNCILSNFSDCELFDDIDYYDPPESLSECTQDREFTMDGQTWVLKEIKPYVEGSSIPMIIESPSKSLFKVEYNDYLDPHIQSVDEQSYYNHHLNATEGVDTIEISDGEFNQSVVSSLIEQRDEVMDSFSKLEENSFLFRRASYHARELNELEKLIAEVKNPKEGSTISFYNLPHEYTDESEYDFEHWENLCTKNGRMYTEAMKFTIGEDTYVAQVVESSEGYVHTSPTITYKNGRWAMECEDGVRLFKKTGTGGHVTRYIDNGLYEY